MHALQNYYLPMIRCVYNNYFISLYTIPLGTCEDLQVVVLSQGVRHLANY